MRNIFPVVFLCFFAGGVSAVAHGGEPQQGPALVVRPHRVHNQTHETRKLTRTLGLSPEQAARVEPILAARDEQIRALRANETTDPQAARQQKHAIARNAREKLNAVLTEPQRQQFAALRHQHHQLQREQQPDPAV